MDTNARYKLAGGLSFAMAVLGIPMVVLAVALEFASHVGAISALAETMAQRMSFNCARSWLSDNPVRKPGIASNLSSVPPVWPNPRPEIIGT